MYAVTVYVNNGNGEEVDSISGTYADATVRKHLSSFLTRDNFIRLEITPSN